MPQGSLLIEITVPRMSSVKLLWKKRIPLYLKMLFIDTWPFVVYDLSFLLVSPSALLSSLSVRYDS